MHMFDKGIYKMLDMVIDLADIFRKRFLDDVHLIDKSIYKILDVVDGVDHFLRKLHLDGVQEVFQEEALAIGWNFIDVFTIGMV